MNREYINPPELGPSPMNIYNQVVAVAGLADPDFLVEVEAIAVIGDGQVYVADQAKAQ